MAEANAATCRANAAIWTAKAAETPLPQLRLSYLASAAAWSERADRMETAAVMRDARLKAAGRA